jgi:hypothetical protein
MRRFSEPNFVAEGYSVAFIFKSYSKVNSNLLLMKICLMVYSKFLSYYEFVKKVFNFYRLLNEPKMTNVTKLLHDTNCLFVRHVTSVCLLLILAGDEL